MKSFFFSIIRKLFYFINKIYFNYFLYLKSNLKTSNKKKDFIHSYNNRLKNFIKNFPKYYDELDLKKFKRIAIYNAIDLPNPGDFNFGAFLHYTLKKYIKKKNKDITILEVGTAKGFSTLCFSLALNDYKFNSKIISLDVISSYEKFFQKTFLGNFKVSRREIMSKIESNLLNKIIFLQGDSLSDLKKIYLNQIDFCFLDGEHNRKYLSNELNYVEKFQKRGDLIIVDDYNKELFPEVFDTVNEFVQDKSYKVSNDNFDESHKVAVLIKN